MDEDKKSLPPWVVVYSIEDMEREIEDRRKERKRGKARPSKQLGGNQKKLLNWLLSKEEEIKASGDIKAERSLRDRGILWSAKRFWFDTYPDMELTSTKRASVSKSLGRLKDRGLVELRDKAMGRGTKPRTSHVRLTPEGRKVAQL